MTERLVIPTQTSILIKQNPTKEERDQLTKDKIIFYLTKLEILKFPKTDHESKISEYISDLKYLLTKTFKDNKGAREALNTLEKNYKKIKLNGDLLGNTTVQKFVEYYSNPMNFELVNGMENLQINIAKKIIEKIKQSIET